MRMFTERWQIEESIVGARMFQEIATVKEYEKAEAHIRRMCELLEKMPIEKRPKARWVTVLLSIFK